MGIRVDSVSGGYLVIEVFPDTPAETAGLKEGDTIIQVDSTATVGIPFTDLVPLLLGEIGESVQLTVQRDEETVTITVN